MMPSTAGLKAEAKTVAAVAGVATVLTNTPTPPVIKQTSKQKLSNTFNRAREDVTVSSPATVATTATLSGSQETVPPSRAVDNAAEYHHRRIAAKEALSTPADANSPPAAATLACDSLRLLASWLQPKIAGTPPFGADQVPRRYRRAWCELLARCPDGVSEWQWAQAIYDARDLFETWGAEIERIGWADDDIFERPDGLIWFLCGEYVAFPGSMTAHTSSKRIWRRLRR